MGASSSSLFVPRLILLMLGSVAVLATPASAQPDLHVGTWTLNVAKSTYEPGPPPRSQVRTYLPQGDGLKVVIETVQPLGIKTRSEYAALFDGKDNPLRGNAEADAISLVRIDAWTFEATLKKRGKVTIVVRNTVSKDGKTMTVTSKGVGARGRPVRSAAVFSKQQVTPSTRH